MRFSVSRFAVIASIACVLLGLALTGKAQTAVVIPPEPHLAGAAEFVHVLQGAGLVVESVQRSHLEGMFRDTEHAAYITTNHGVVEVAILNGDMDAERITITYSKEPGDPARHRYIVQGVPTNGGGGEWHSAYPLYFTLHHKWFVLTMDAQLDALVKHALGQTNLPN